MAENGVLSVRWPKARVIKELSLVIGGGCFLALMSQVAIPLIGTPIPVTLQTLGVFLLGGILGAKRAAWSVIAYLLQGCFCLPVFAGGVSNPVWFLSPQAGFLLSFVIAAFVIGKLLEKKNRYHIFHLVGVLCIGQLVIFGLGMIWLSFFVGISKGFLLGVVPFLSGAAFKIMVGSLVIRFYRGYLQK